jgi:hypothetical protein
MAEDFFKRFDDEMQRRHPSAAAPAAVAPASAAGAALADPFAPAVVPAIAAVAGAVAMLLLMWVAH